MVKLEKSSKEEFCQCTSCQCENSQSEIFKISIGKSERQMVNIKLCYECLCDFIGKATFENIRAGK